MMGAVTPETFFLIVKNCEFTFYSYGAISKCGEGEDDERE